MQLRNMSIRALVLYLTLHSSLSLSIISNRYDSARRLLGSPFSVEFQPICDTIQDLIKTFTLSVDAAKDEGD